MGDVFIIQGYTPDTEGTCAKSWKLVDIVIDGNAYENRL